MSIGAISDWKQGLSMVFSNRKYLFSFIALALLFLPVYAVLTDIVVLEPLSLNPNLKPVEAGLITMVAILAALGFTVAIFQVFEAGRVSKKSVGGSVLGAGAGGSAIATFATACTICQPIWLVWLGLGGASAFLIDYSIYLIFASIGLLLLSLHLGLGAVVKGCAVRKRVKAHGK